MKSKMLLKEKTVHGTPLLPVAIHHLSYPPNVDNFFFLHWHYEFEFLVVLEGAILYTIEDEEYCVTAGEGLFVPSNQLHAARSHKGMPCEACVVVFHPNLFSDNKQGSTYSKFVNPILKGDIEFKKVLSNEEQWQRIVIERMKEIDAMIDYGLHDIELLLKSKLFEIWHNCYQNAAPSASPWRESKNYKIERMQPVLAYIQAYYKEEISLKTLADILPMSEGQFCHAFKEMMNMPPIAYVIRYRLLQSCSLLVETDWKIADIAKSVGFNNISYFNREFSKAIGCSPSKYRREG